jgi:hypothetical protein
MSQLTPLCVLPRSTRLCRQEVPTFLDEKAIEDLGVKGGLTFLDVRRKLLENKPRVGTQSYS